MSKYVGVKCINETCWEAKLKFRRETAPTLADAEEFFELICAQLNVDPTSKYRDGYHVGDDNSAGRKRPSRGGGGGSDAGDGGAGGGGGGLGSGKRRRGET